MLTELLKKLIKEFVLFIILSRHPNVMPLYSTDNLNFETSVCELHRGGLEPIGKVWHPVWKHSGDKHHEEIQTLKMC